MNAPNRNTLWANIFVDELARAGLRLACIAPGSRSTPLTVAFANHSGITVYSLLDERGAAYFALGTALATGRPAALVCTSGTATANFFPAIIEANNAHVPLLVLTTDRPHELRHSGANQTIDQVKLFGDHVRWFVDVALPEANPPVGAVRSLRALAGRAIAATQGFPPGPVHLNFPFRKPLEPTPVPADGPGQAPENPRAGGEPWVRISRGQLTPSPGQIDALSRAIASSRRGVIVCGPRCPDGEFPAAVSALAVAAKMPLLADALSGVRFGLHPAGSAIIGGYETFLQRRVIDAWPAPDLILHFGAMPISKWLGEFMAASNNSARHIQVSDTGAWQDETHTAADFIWAEPAAVCQAVTRHLENQAGEQEPAWLERFRRAEAQTWRIIDQMRAETFFEGALLADIVEWMPRPGALFVASSLPVRHLDQFARPYPVNLRLFANRGASGIDGTIASAVGVATASRLPLVLVIGDLAFYHDLNSLLALQRSGVKATIVLINNNGGGIFHRLPIANFEPPFTDLFVTPHGLNFAPAAQLFNLEYAAVNEPADFQLAFRAALEAKTPQLIEVFTSATAHEQTRRAIIERVVQAITKPS